MNNLAILNNCFQYTDINNLVVKPDRLVHLLSQAPVTIYTCKPNGVFSITFLSDNIKDLFGYKAEEFLHNPDFWINNIHPDDHDQVISGMNDILEGKSILRKYRFKMKDGHWKWIRDRAKLVTNQIGKPMEVIGAWTDMSELIHTEEALRKSEEKHRFLLEQINAGVMIHTPDTRVVSCNQQVSNLLGLTEKQILGMVTSDFESTFICEDETPMLFDQFPVNQVIRRHKVVQNIVVGIPMPLFSRCPDKLQYFFRHHTNFSDHA